MKKLLTTLVLLPILYSLLLTACSTQNPGLTPSSKNPNSLAESSVIFTCSDSKNDCSSSNYNIPKGFSHTWSQLFYDDDDIYASLLKANDLNKLDDGEWCVFKNGEEQFCANMNAGTSGPIVEITKKDDAVVVKYLITSTDETVQTEERLIPDVK